MSKKNKVAGVITSEGWDLETYRTNYGIVMERLKDALKENDRLTQALRIANPKLRTSARKKPFTLNDLNKIIERMIQPDIKQLREWELQDPFISNDCL